MPNEKYGIFCKTHKNAKYVTSCPECLLCPLQDSLTNGWFPTAVQAFSCYLTVNKEHSEKNIVTDVASDITLHWISCDIYTMTR